MKGTQCLCELSGPFSENLTNSRFLAQSVPWVGRREVHASSCCNLQQGARETDDQAPSQERAS